MDEDKMDKFIPWISMRSARVTMFHLVEPLYSMMLRALAT